MLSQPPFILKRWGERSAAPGKYQLSTNLVRLIALCSATHYTYCMKNVSESNSHPGVYVRTHVIPSDLSVKAAAERLGVGRPALSNFLNGNAALSPEMALRLDKAFGVDRRKLLEMQSAYDQRELQSSGKDVAVRAFVPSFLTIKAREIEQWASSDLGARELLPVLLRKLVHSTGNELRRVDFPGYDNSQRKGADGIVEAGAATPWIPAGKSYWEFGTDQRPDRKAEGDYNARIKSVDAKERSNSSFIFVTPRNWPGKSQWEKRKSQAGDWKSVRALDASDLEQWLEQSVPAQIWLAEQLDQVANGYETLDEAWSRWATGSEPSLTPEIFAPSLKAHRDTLKEWLENPSKRPFVVAADSIDEALAFLACALDDENLCAFKDRAAIFTSAQELSKMINSSVPFIPIVHSEDTEKELRDAHRRLHCIIVRPRNRVDGETDIALDLLDYDDFKHALISMGLDDDDIDRLSAESGRSLTILRRRLSPNTAIRTPLWAGDSQTARSLIPMALIGTWHTDSAADRNILSMLADSKYETIEQDIARLRCADDSPVWSAGRCCGVSSKIDALFAIAGMVTQSDLDRFFDLAEEVLSEADPALELPEKDRWAAAVFGKKRTHSGPLRDGICETLVLLSIHGNNLFQDRLGFKIEHRVAHLIHKLLTPLNLEKLLSHNQNLPRYAEAAPQEFLSIIEQDVFSENSVVLGLLKPVDRNSIGASPSRTGLLWALECLAWEPTRMPRVARILAKLSRTKINDNWVNKPDTSLKGIFRSWMPQTSASVEQRVKSLEKLARDFPDVTWGIALDQIKPGSQIGRHSYRPRWRSDASGAGHVVSPPERFAFCRRALDLLLAWPTHNEKTLGDLVECMQSIPDDQATVWTHIDHWAENADDTAKSELRERIRRHALTRRAQRSGLGTAARDRAQKTYERLLPSDPVARHRWLFADAWVQESVGELEEDDLDYRKREERIDQLRRDAMSEILTEQGMDGVLELMAASPVAGLVGQYAATCIIGEAERLKFIARCLSLSSDSAGNPDACIRGFLSFIHHNEITAILRTAAQDLSADQQVRLFICAPFQDATWRLLDEHEEDVRAGYWESVFPHWGNHSALELHEMIDRLLEMKRPRAAFHAVHMSFDEIETTQLKRLLHNVATVAEEPDDHYALNRYYISEALKSLDGRPGMSRDEMAQLEFLYIDALDDSEHGIPNLEDQIANSPLSFVQAVALAYKRSDEEDDPPEWRIEDLDKKRALARAAHRLLDQIKKIPGADENGEIDESFLRTWIVEVRELCGEHARSDIGDQQLGQLLSQAPAEEDGLWPCRAVCQVMEEIASEEIAQGFLVGVYNSRGTHWRGEGGDQERALAAKYRAWAEWLHFDYPYVGSVLERIALSYDHDAAQEDTEAKVRKRLRH